MSKAEVEQREDYKSFVQRLESYTQYMPPSELAGSDRQEYQALREKMQSYVEKHTGKNASVQRNK